MKKGFTLFYAVLIASLLLAVGLAIFNITFKELVLSSGARESEGALYAADSALECALFWDLKHEGVSESPFGFYGDTLRSGLTGYWRFEEGPGSGVALDASPSRNHGVLTNMNTATAWTTGHAGGGLQFDGVDDRVLAGDTDYGSGAGGSLWVRFSSVATQQMLVAQSVAGVEVQVQMYGPGLGNRFRLRIGTATGADIADSATAATSGAWYHLAWTYDGTDAKLYINGSPDSTIVQNSSGAVFDYNQQYGLGGRNDGTLPLNGVLDDVRLYNRALTPEEIDALFDGEPNNAFVPPVGEESGVGCAAADITDPATGWDAAAGWEVEESAQSATTTFDMQFGGSRCASVAVAKSAATTTIVSRGYNTCVLSDPRRVERAIRATY